MDSGELLRAEDDAQFERALLDSARLDALPAQDVQKAWQLFTGTLGVALIASGDQLAFARTARRLALKWLMLGAVGGGLLAVAALGIRHRSDADAASSPGRPPIAAVGEARAAASSASTSLDASTEKAPTISTGANSEPTRAHARGALLSARTQRHAQPEASQRSPGQDRSSAQSTLLAEVALLDSVRSRLNLGDSAGALRLIERYENEFPKGQLAKDAAVLTIEALAGTGNRAEATRRAERFLERSPDDPHAARVRRLMAP